jgi:hypothetical protein
MKTHTHSRTTYIIPGTNIEVELPFNPDSVMDYKEPVIRVAGDQITLGYLAHDDSCENPLENDEYAGHIYEARRNGPTLRQYEEALALGRYEGGERNPHAVLLDVYEHGGVSYSLQGAGTQCRFDTARAGAVWVPSKALLKDAPGGDADWRWAARCAEMAAAEYTAWCNGQCYGLVIVTYDLAGEQQDCTTLWGHVGDDAAYEALQGEMPAEVPA